MKKKLFSVLLVLSMAFSLAACGGNNDKGNTDDKENNQTKENDNNETEDKNIEDENVSDGELHFTVSLASEPESIDPSKNTATDASSYIQHSFEGLMKFTIASEPGVEPELVPGQAAELPEVSEDGLIYTFKLRDDIKWSDGKEVTADDFVYSWRRIVNPETASEYSYIINMVLNAPEIEKGEEVPEELGIEAIDEKTLKITLADPCAYFLQLCAFSSLMPLREDIVEGNDSWTFDNYVCNGKYIVTEWIHDDFIMMEKNEHYYAPEDVTTDSIKWVLKDDDNALLADYKSETLDFINQVPADEAPTLISEGTLNTIPQLGTYGVVFNIENEAFQDPIVRKAFSLAIDRNYIVENVTQTNEIPANSWVPTGIKNGDSGDFHDAKGGYYSIKDEDYEKNCEEAKKLLEEAGYPNGEGFPVVTYLYNTMDRHQKIYEALAYMWQDVLGVTVTGSNQDWNVFLKSRSEGDFEVARHGWIADVSDPINFLDMWTTGNGNNYAQYKNDDYDALIASTFKEADINKRAELLHQAEDMIIEEDVLVAPLFYYTEFYCLNPEITGASHTQLGYWHFWNLKK